MICSVDVDNKKKTVCTSTDAKVKWLLDEYIQQLLDCQKKESISEQFICTTDNLGNIVNWCKYALIMHTITKDFVVKHKCYTRGIEELKKKEEERDKSIIIPVKGIMLHSVGVAQPNAVNFVKNFNKANLENCAHAFIDGNDGRVYQVLPWNFNANHSGKHEETDESVNKTHIGIEMCEPKEITYIKKLGDDGKLHTTSKIKKLSGDKLDRARKVVDTTYASAVKLFAALCIMYELNPLENKVIISHNEGHNVHKMASGHSDPEHLWKQLGTKYTMDTFREAVKMEMDTIISQGK